MLKECENKSNWVVVSGTLLDASSEVASFASCNDPVKRYCSHCLSKEFEAQRQEVTKSTELVSKTIKNCVHSSDLGGVINMRWGSSTKYQGF